MSQSDARSSDVSCVSCRTSKVQFECPLCEADICSKCVMRPPQGSFFYRSDTPAELKHPHYCQSCFAEEVETAVSQYEETLALAKEVFVFFTTQKKEIPLVRKSKELLMVQEQEDRDVTILKLAYMASERGFNAIISTDVQCVKVRNEGYQHSVWSGKAYAAEVKGDRLERYGFE